MATQQGAKNGKEETMHDKESKPVASGGPVLGRHQSYDAAAASFAARMQREEYARQMMLTQQHPSQMAYHQTDTWHYHQQQALVNANLLHYEYV